MVASCDTERVDSTSNINQKKQIAHARKCDLLFDDLLLTTYERTARSTVR